MRSKIFTFLLLIASFDMSHQQAQADAIEPELLGLVIRPQLIYHLVQQYGSSQDESPFNACLGLNEGSDNQLYLSGTFKTELRDPSWSSKKKGALVIQSVLKSLYITASIYKKCPEELKSDSDEVQDQSLLAPKQEDFLGEISAATNLEFSPLTLGVWILPYFDAQLGTNSRLKIEVTSDILPEQIEGLKFSSPDLPKIASLLNSDYGRSAILNASLKPLSLALTNFLNEKLRGLAFAESVLDLFQKGAIWSENGVSVQSGAVHLQNSARSLTRRELLFTFYPRSNGSIFIEPDQIELYANASFLGGKELDSLGLEGDKNQRLQQLKKLIKTTSISSDAKLTRKPVTKTNSDITLIFTEKLVNKALQSIYLEDLLKFSSSIYLKDKVQGLLTKEPADLAVKVQLGSDTVPRLRFAPNQLSLEVSDYFLNIGTWLEDRLIPSTEIQAQVNVSAKIEVNPKTQSVNLVLDSKTFKIQLSESDKTPAQLQGQELRLLEKVSKEVWANFFEEFPELPLFSTLFQAIGNSVHIQEVEVVDELILVHMNLEAGKK